MKASDWHRRRILQEHRWSRIYEAENGISVNVSKFITDDIGISADMIMKEWTSWSDDERIAFVGAFSQKQEFSVEDEKILDFLMAVDDERIWSSIAYGLTRHSQKSVYWIF